METENDKGLGNEETAHFECLGENMIAVNM